VTLEWCLGQKIAVDLALEGEKLCWKWPGFCSTDDVAVGWLGTSEFEGHMLLRISIRLA
jgi:hypothetical protein